MLLGGVLTAARGDEFEGPSLDPAATTVYRWEVMEDARLWDRLPLGSVRTSSRVDLSPGGRTGGAETARLARLAAWQREGHARFNIRLLVTYADGAQVLL
jgi:hypothetical protein